MGEERRIADLTAISAFRSNDYIAVDNASEAQTKKLPASAITDPINVALNMVRDTSTFPTGDAYSTSSAYKVGDMVIHSDTLYRCKTACSAASWSVNQSNFEAISLASALTDVNSALSNTKVYTIDKTLAFVNGVANATDFNDIIIAVESPGNTMTFAANLSGGVKNGYSFTARTSNMTIDTGFSGNKTFKISYIKAN